MSQSSDPGYVSGFALISAPPPSPFIFLSDPNTQMIARGKNASDLFPAVVKNVACKNIEVSAVHRWVPIPTQD